MLMTRMAMWGLVRSMRRVASMPPTPGMPRSMRMTSGWRSAASEMASSPSLASPTTSRSDAEASSALSPSRKWGWSSAMSVRIGSTPLCLLRPKHIVPGSGFGATGQTRANTGTTRRHGLYLEGSAELGRSFAHGRETDARTVTICDTLAIVGNLHAQPTNLLIEHETYDAVARLSVTHHVVQGFED